MPRIDVAVVYDDGKIEIVNGGRPAALIAFADKFGHDEPRNYAEVAWLVHRAVRCEEPLEVWQETLEELDPRDPAVERARTALRDGIAYNDVPETDADARMIELAVWLADWWGVKRDPEVIGEEILRGLRVIAAREAAAAELEPIDELEPDPTPAIAGGVA